MKFKYEGEDYDIRFNHGYRNSCKSGQLVRFTTCSISVINREHETNPTCAKYWCLVVDEVVQHVNDQFCKRIGRKLALRKALDSFMKKYVKYAHGTTANKMIRRKIWNSYFAECDRNVHIVNKKEKKATRELEQDGTIRKFEYVFEKVGLKAVRLQ